MDDRQILKSIVSILDKAVVDNLNIYNMKSHTPFYDYSVIASVNSSRQGNAAVDYLKKEVANLGLSVRGVSAMPDSKWFLVDLNSIVIHLFVQDERERYNLDRLYCHLEDVKV